MTNPIAATKRAEIIEHIYRNPKETAKQINDRFGISRGYAHRLKKEVLEGIPVHQFGKRPTWTRDNFVWLVEEARRLNVDLDTLLNAIVTDARLEEEDGT